MHMWFFVSNFSQHKVWMSSCESYFKLVVNVLLDISLIMFWYPLKQVLKLNSTTCHFADIYCSINCVLKNWYAFFKVGRQLYCLVKNSNTCTFYNNRLGNKIWSITYTLRQTRKICKETCWFYTRCFTNEPRTLETIFYKE